MTVPLVSHAGWGQGVEILQPLPSMHVTQRVEQVDSGGS